MNLHTNNLRQIINSKQQGMNEKKLTTFLCIYLSATGTGALQLKEALTVARFAARCFTVRITSVTLKGTAKSGGYISGNWSKRKDKTIHV